MALKGSKDDSADVRASKRARKGFSVGPQNLPDGTHKRKVDKIRRKLVENAKIRKSYDKLKKARALQESTISSPHEDVVQEPSTNTRHPERQALIDGDDGEEKEAEQDDKQDQARDHRSRRHKQPLFQGSLKIAEARQIELDRKREDIQAARSERDKRITERERWRRTMANARGNGKQRKLGKESTVLLEKVKRMLRE